MPKAGTMFPSSLDRSGPVSQFTDMISNLTKKGYKEVLPTEALLADQPSYKLIEGKRSIKIRFRGPFGTYQQTYERSIGFFIDSKLDTIEPGIVSNQDTEDVAQLYDIKEWLINKHDVPFYNFIEGDDYGSVGGLHMVKGMIIDWCWKENYFEAMFLHEGAIRGYSVKCECIIANAKQVRNLLAKRWLAFKIDPLVMRLAKDAD